MKLSLPRLSPQELKTEALAGVTTFFTMSYILIVNPSILATEGTGMSFTGVLTATAVVCFLMTLMMGVLAQLPFAVAPGMGINAYFTYTIVLGMGVPWQTALGVVFWSGVIFLLISATTMREKIVQAIPGNLRIAVAAGIGVFLTFIGLKNAGLVVSHPVTFVSFGKLGFESVAALIGLFVIAVLSRKKSPVAFLVGMIGITLAAVIAGKVSAPDQFLSQPDFSSTFLHLDLWGALKLSMIPAMMGLFFTDLFDSISTFIGVSQATGLTDKNGDPRNLKQGLVVDSFATLSAGLLGSSSGTTYVESSAGISAGGKTGWTSVFTALCFLPCLFIAPLAAMVPVYATAPVLIVVGALMFKSVAKLKLDSMEDVLPAFLTIVLVPLTFSITQGIIWGFISHVVLFVLVGRRREIPVMMYVIAAISVLLLLVAF